MNRSYALLLLILLSPLCRSETDSYVVQRVEDGDTLVIELDGQTARLQLLGIDAPEDVPNPKLQRDQARTGLERSTLLGLGRSASDHLRQLLPPGTHIGIEGDLKRKDKYGRIPVIALDQEGRSINAKMVEDGFALVLGAVRLPADQRRNLESLERAARTEGRGLWGSQTQLMQAWSGR